MKMVHKNCGGVVTESKSFAAYDSEEYGIVPAYECTTCSIEILGDAQITFVAENDADQVQIEALQDVIA